MASVPRYPVEMKETEMQAALAAYKGNQPQEAARLFTKAHLAGLYEHCVVRPHPNPEDRHFCALTATWNREIGYGFMWITRRMERAMDDPYDAKVFHFQTDKCGEHQYYAYKIVAHGGVEDEGVDA